MNHLLGRFSNAFRQGSFLFSLYLKPGRLFNQKKGFLGSLSLKATPTDLSCVKGFDILSFFIFFFLLIAKVALILFWLFDEILTYQPLSLNIFEKKLGFFLFRLLFFFYFLFCFNKIYRNILFYSWKREDQVAGPVKEGGVGLPAPFDLTRTIHQNNAEIRR